MKNIEEWTDKKSGALVYVGPRKKVIELQDELREVIKAAGCVPVFLRVRTGPLYIMKNDGDE